MAVAPASKGDAVLNGPFVIGRQGVERIIVMFVGRTKYVTVGLSGY